MQKVKVIETQKHQLQYHAIQEKLKGPVKSINVQRKRCFIKTVQWTVLDNIQKAGSWEKVHLKEKVI